MNLEHSDLSQGVLEGGESVKRLLKEMTTSLLSSVRATVAERRV